jgi:pyruvate/2-oxoglutarate dehydrogenase complex dihydrolipoamide acyltransferase (E2) component
MEVDLGEALALLQAHQARAARRGIELSVTACVAFAVVAALGKHRMLNSAWSDDGIILRSRVHVLVEQTMQRDTHTLLLTDAADLSLLGMARRLAEVGQQGNGQRYDVEPTFAINERATPWWGHTLPGTYTAQLTIGVPQHRPKVVETTNGDQIVVRPTMLLMLAYDARVLAQPEVDTFLADVKQQLEHLRSL